MKPYNLQLAYFIFSTIYFFHVHGLQEPCDNKGIYCFYKGYKPFNIYLSARTSDLTSCLQRCSAENDCKMVAYGEQVRVLLNTNKKSGTYGTYN